MQMTIHRARIVGYQSQYGRLPDNLDDVGETSDVVEYTRVADDVFRLIGTSGEISVDWNSTQPFEELVGDADAIVSGISSTPGGAGSS